MASTGQVPPGLVDREATFASGRLGQAGFSNAAAADLVLVITEHYFLKTDAKLSAMIRELMRQAERTNSLLLQIHDQFAAPAR